jgi:hypothetical protein
MQYDTLLHLMVARFKTSRHSAKEEALENRVLDSEEEDE